jgi:uncharacterized membrane protein
MPTNPTPRSNKTPLSTLPGGGRRKTYFGLSALIIGVVSGLFLGANFGSAYLNITPETFGPLNNMTAFLYCILAPLALILAIIGYVLKNDSRQYSLIAIVVVLIPFIVLMIQFFYSVKNGNVTFQ